MKFFKYLFFLVLLVIVLGSLYIATISVPAKLSLEFESELHPELFQQKIVNFETYPEWLNELNNENADARISNIESAQDATISWQNERFEGFNIQNEYISKDSLVQTYNLKTWLSQSKNKITWQFSVENEQSIIQLDIENDATFWQKVDFVLNENSHQESIEKMFSESFSNLENLIKKEIAVYDIRPIGTVEYGNFYLLHATSASKIDFEKIIDKSQPTFRSIENFMNEQNFEISKRRLILLENLFEDEANLIFSAGFGTEKQTAIPDEYEILSKYVEENTFLKTQLKGDHVNLKEMLQFTEKYIADRNLEIDKNKKPILEFKVDHSQNINPSEWVTNLYIPVFITE
ncbi:MAG: GyrI-like domain-containing protein [Psychroflexus sp.]